MRPGFTLIICSAWSAMGFSFRTKLYLMNTTKKMQLLARRSGSDTGGKTANCKLNGGAPPSPAQQTPNWKLKIKNSKLNSGGWPGRNPSLYMNKLSGHRAIRSSRRMSLKNSKHLFVKIVVDVSAQLPGVSHCYPCRNFSSASCVF